MKVVLFCHAFTSCWNNGHAHFLRGIAREMLALGHRLVVCEAASGWSRTNALLDGGAGNLHEAERLVPGVDLRRADVPTIEQDLDALLDDADLVLIHEWNEPSLIAAVGRWRQHSPFLLFFVDAHHRAISAPAAIDGLELDAYDAVLAFGNSLREVYAARGWGRRAYTWHEAADTALFRPRPGIEQSCDLVWIGNWGDEERSQELREFLIEPVRQLGISGCVHGVRYPQHARDTLTQSGIAYRGWLANHRVPDAFAAARVTVHVPREAYKAELPGIPTIRVFEAMACGIPLICSPWRDDEQLFPPGAYLQVDDGRGMKAALKTVLADRDMAQELARTGREAIERRHTCRHRVETLLSIADSLRGSSAGDRLTAMRDMEAAE
jgi:spore maturation protein CgeB